MLQVTYNERYFLDNYKCIDKVETFKAYSSFTQGGLMYFKTSRFDYKTIAIDSIIKIKKV